MCEHESLHARDGSHDGNGHGTSTSNRKPAAVSAINLLGFVLELAGGLLFGSVALVSDAFQHLDAHPHST